MLSDKEVWMRAYCAVLPTIAAVPNDTHIADVDAYVQGVAMVAKLHATQAVKALHECYPTNEPPDLSAETLAAMRCAQMTCTHPQATHAIVAARDALNECEHVIAGLSDLAAREAGR